MMKIELVTLAQESDGWQVEARVSGMPLEMALSLQTFMLSLVAGDFRPPPVVEVAPAPVQDAPVVEAPTAKAPKAPRKVVVHDEAPPPPPPPPPAPVEPAKSTPLVAAGDLGDAELVMRLADAPKLRDVIVLMTEAGIRGTDALVDTATRLKDRVPVLSRIGDLRERVTRAAEVLGVA
jgi:hypothetical protein